MLIAAYAAGCSYGYLYINAEAHLSAERMETALQQARQLGVLGTSVLGSGFGFDVEIRRGAGGYVCGEETTLLNTVEGLRREPRLRPPFPTESGLFSRPTVINNVETLANVPLVLDGIDNSTGGGPSAGEEIPPSPLYQRGARGDLAQDQRWEDVGLESARGTKLISLSGAVQRPGLVEVPMGTTLSQVIFQAGGGPPAGRDIGVVAVGGPSSGVLPVSELDTPLRPGMLHPSGVVMGAGGVMVVDDTVPAIDVVRRLAAYNAAESCGKCTPCREGAPRMAEALDRLASGQGSPKDLDELRYLAEIVGAASLCGLGQMAGGPVNSALHFFGDELARLAGGS
jgi:NADH:ubiquinone oxidoreductase subunit F (NADH-binding)